MNWDLYNSIIIEYQKIINLIDNIPNQPSKVTTKNRVEINDNFRGNYNTNSQIKFMTIMLKSRLCDYSDAYILIKGTITVPNPAGAGQPANNNSIEVVFKNCASFNDSIGEINHTQIDNVKDIDVVMSMYNSVKYSDNYSKTYRSLWQYYRDDYIIQIYFLLMNTKGMIK